MLQYLQPPSHPFNQATKIARLPEHADQYPELKDPSIVKITDSQYLMYASIGSSITQTWIVGRFEASSPDGEWHEVPPVTFHYLSGAQLCAPAVRYDAELHRWTMYVQNCCFEEGGFIALASSIDGQNFFGASKPLFTREMLGEHSESIVGLYDAGISEVMLDGEAYLCLLFSGYRRVGCGDIFMTYRKKSASDTDWSLPQRILAQEDVPFHNHPDSPWFEWGLEGAQITQLGDGSFLLIGVCFMPKPAGFLGTRQRVFFAHAASLLGPFTPLTVPFLPQEVDGKRGENGHPDAFIWGNKLWIMYQERLGEGKPWHFRQAYFDVLELNEYLISTHNSQNYVPDLTFSDIEPATTPQLNQPQQYAVA